MNHRALCLVVFGALVGAGCGGDGGATDTPSAFCRAYDSHWAASQYRCVGGQGAPATYYMSNCAALDEALAAGRIAYDPAAAADCLAQVDEDPGLACGDEVPCLWSVIKGRVAEGDPCKDYKECAPNSICAPTSTDSCGPFVCTRFGAALGEACGGPDNVTCGGSLLCQPTAAGGTDGTCVARTAGLPCSSPLDCSYAEFCDATGVCKPVRPIGASCADDFRACAVLDTCDATTQKCVAGGTAGKSCGLVCWNSWCAPPEAVNGGTCMPFLADGSPCTDAYQCKSGVCSGGVCTACAP